MFGYITADARLLTEEQQTRYAACYCGLCRRLGRECSAVSRLTLTYDMTFLVLLLSSSMSRRRRQAGTAAPSIRSKPAPTGTTTPPTTVRP